MRFPIVLLVTLLLSAIPSRAQEDEIVANLAGGRVIIHVARDAILFAAIDHPLEATSVPPRVAQIDRGHIAVFFGASEWQLTAAPKPIRLDHDVPEIFAANKKYAQPEGSESDLEQIGLAYLEKLRPLAARLHHRIDLKPEDPLLEIVLIGYAPNGYGPEVWLIEYRVEQQQPGAQADYLQTHILRPRFTQLYPPEKHDPRTLVEVRSPAELTDVPLLGLLQQNDPAIAKLRASDPRFAKVVELVEHGQANKAVSADAADFLRAVLPIIAGKATFIQATIGEESGFRWVVPPDEPVEKAKPLTPEEKERPPDAPTLRRKPSSSPP